MSFPDTGGFVCVLVSGGVAARAVRWAMSVFDECGGLFFTSR
jgi:hypothetical protein